MFLKTSRWSNLSLETQTYLRQNLTLDILGSMSRYVVLFQTTVCIAYHDNEPIGWAALDEECYLLMVFVHPNWRRNGIATKLVKHFSEDHPILCGAPPLSRYFSEHVCDIPADDKVLERRIGVAFRFLTPADFYPLKKIDIPIYEQALQYLIELGIERDVPRVKLFEAQLTQLKNSPLEEMITPNWEEIRAAAINQE